MAETETKTKTKTKEKTANTASGATFEGKKWILIFINFFFQGIGGDHIYLGLYKTAVAKIVFAIVVAIAFAYAAAQVQKQAQVYVESLEEHARLMMEYQAKKTRGEYAVYPNHPQPMQTPGSMFFALGLFFLLMIWNFVDTARIYYNIITKAPMLPLGVGKKWGQDPNDDHISKVMAIIFGILMLFGGLFSSVFTTIASLM